MTTKTGGDKQNPFISPEEFNKPIITANGVKIYPRDLKPGKFKNPGRQSPKIGNRWR